MIELLVAAGLFSLVITLVLGFLVQSGRWARDIRAFQGAEQDLSASLARIVKELFQAPQQGVLAFYPSGDPNQGDIVLAWSTPYTEEGNYVHDSSSFEPIYQGYRIIYHDLATHSIYASYLAQAPSSTILAPTSAMIQAHINPSADRPLVREVESFQLLHPISLAPTVEVLNPSRLRLVVRGKEGREQSLVLNREVRFAY